MQIFINVDRGHLLDVQRTLRAIPGAFPRVMRRAAARAVSAGRTMISKAVRDEIRLKKKDVDDRIATKVTTAGRLPEGLIRITRKAVPLVLFPHSWSRRRPGVSVGVRKGEGRQILKSTFLHTSRAGRLNVNERKLTGSTRVSRLPIGARYGPTVVGVVEGNPLGERSIRGIGLVFHKRVDHEMAFEIRKAAAKK